MEISFCPHKLVSLHENEKMFHHKAQLEEGGEPLKSTWPSRTGSRINMCVCVCTFKIYFFLASISCWGRKKKKKEEEQTIFIVPSERKLTLRDVTIDRLVVSSLRFRLGASFNVCFIFFLSYKQKL